MSKGSGGGGNGGRTGGGGGGSPKTIGDAISEMKANIASGKLKKSDAIEAVRIMTQRANQAEESGNDRTARALDMRIEALTRAASIKGELYAKGITQSRGRPIGSIGKGVR